MANDITRYVEAEGRSFAELPPSDTDLLAFSALMYAEFEALEGFGEPVRIGDLADLDTVRRLVGHDYYPQQMEALVSAMAASPRFSDVLIERFECIVDEARVIQFAGACFVTGDGNVVVAFRGTDSKLVGWHEDFTMAYLEAMAGQVEALRYAHEAAAAYPQGKLLLCGHSKGGSEAEYAAVFADDALARRIRRAVSFDGPSLFKAGGVAAPELAAYDLALLERYEAVGVPIKRYVFPSRLGLVLERRDPALFPHAATLDPDHAHSVCAVEVAGGEIALVEPGATRDSDVFGLAGLLAGFSAAERKVLVDESVAACRDASITVDLSDKGMAKLAKALKARYRTLPHDRKRIFRKAIAKAMLGRR